MNYTGLIIGVSTFFLIGIFHPLVIKAEYHFGKRCWWVFMLLGIGGVVASMLMVNLILSIVCGVFAFSCFWSIGEIFEQERRVQRGWFPENPKRAKK